MLASGKVCVSICCKKERVVYSVCLMKTMTATGNDVIQRRKIFFIVQIYKWRDGGDDGERDGWMEGMMEGCTDGGDDGGMYGWS